MAIIYNGVNVAQDPLVSGTNIKTVNGTSLLGSGNIVAGGSSTDYGAIGTYVIAGNSNWSASIAVNTTVAGSSLYRHIQTGGDSFFTAFNTNATGTGEVVWRSSGGSPALGLSGTWRSVTAGTGGSQFTYAGVVTTMSRPNLYVRVS
jgi:hypothetical protein